MDGVLRNMNAKMIELYNQKFKTDLTLEDITDYDVSKSFPLFEMRGNMSAIDFFFHKNAKKVFYLSEPYDGVENAMQKLKDNGHKIVIVTWQFSNINKKLTLDWLDALSIPYDDICFTKDKWMVQGDVLIDDNPEFILDERDRSYKYLVQQPYNQDCNFDGSKVRSFKAAVELICNG
jgi:uncharacterized HAD superfamily protein